MTWELTSEALFYHLKGKSNKRRLLLPWSNIPESASKQSVPLVK